MARSILWGYNWKSDWDKDRFKFDQYSKCGVGSCAACTAYRAAPLQGTKP